MVSLISLNGWLWEDLVGSNNAPTSSWRSCRCVLNSELVRFRSLQLFEDASLGVSRNVKLRCPTKTLSPTSCSFRLPRIFYSGSLHLSGKLDSNPPLPLTDLPGTPRDTEVKSDVHLVGWVSRVGDLLRYVDPMSFLHGDGHKVIPSNGGREVGENWGEKV